MTDAERARKQAEKFLDRYGADLLPWQREAGHIKDVFLRQAPSCLIPQDEPLKHKRAVTPQLTGANPRR